MKTFHLLLFLIPVSILGQGWERTYGHGGGYSVEQISENGYIVFCNSYDQNIYIIKTDNNGDTLWTNTFGETEHYYGTSGIQTINGGYVTTGWTDPDISLPDVLLIKTDISGNLLWTRTYGGDKMDVGSSVQQTFDNGFIITGKTRSEFDNFDIYLIKTDSTGNTLWSRTYGGDTDDYGASVLQTTDGGYIITGTSVIYQTGYSCLFLQKTDINGEPEWNKTFGDYDGDGGGSVQQTTDGGYIITGYTKLTDDSQDVLLIKTDSNGDSLWTKKYGKDNNEGGVSVQQTTDEGYIITGYTEMSDGIRDVYLIKTDSNGDTLWSKTYGGTNHDSGTSVRQTADGGYIITGVYDEDFIVLIKTDENGIITSLIETQIPNPNRKLVKIVDLLGREITKTKNSIPFIEIYDDGTSQKKMKIK